MKTLNLLSAIALVFSVQFSNAQSVMKDPVSYQLKNGMTIITAENAGTPKVFANLSFEGKAYAAGNAVVQEVLNTIFTQQLPKVNAGLSYTDKGMNVAVPAAQFEKTIADLYTYIAAPEFTAEALAAAKAAVEAHVTAQDKYYPTNVTIAAIEGIDLAIVKAYYAEVSNPATAYLTVAGNVKAAAVKVYAKKGFDKLKVADSADKDYLVSNF
jgi:predicted Zn-dependent peptidase